MKERPEPEKSKDTTKEDFIFDPKAELEKVKKVPKPVRGEALGTYKERLKMQKGGLARMQEEIVRSIRENPDITSGSLMKIVKMYARWFGFTREQLETTEYILNEYQKKHESVVKFREQYPNDQDLYETVFGRKPFGEVIVVVGPMTLYFRCLDLRDYAFVYRGKFLNKLRKNVTDKDLEMANHSGGVFIFESRIPELRGTLILENTPSVFRSAPVHTHEEQHAINDMISNSLDETQFFWEKVRIVTRELFNMWGLKKQAHRALKQGDPEKIETALARYMRVLRGEHEEQTKDELLAYFKEGQNPNDTLRTLKKPPSEGGLYGFFSEIPALLEDDFKKELKKPKDRKILDDIYTKIFSAEYQALLSDGLNAISLLERAGYSKEKIIAVLVKEPLRKWDKVVSRLVRYPSQNTGEARRQVVETRF